MKIVVKEIFDKVNYSLAVIGKGIKDVEFDNIVLSSGQMMLVEDYVNDALRRLVSKSHGVFFDKSKDNDSGSFGLYFKSDDSVVESIEMDIDGYLVDYCLFRVFSLKGMNEMMKVYYDLSESRYNDLMYYLMKRDVPAMSEKLSGTTGSCE